MPHGVNSQTCVTCIFVTIFLCSFFTSNLNREQTSNIIILHKHRILYQTQAYSNKAMILEKIKSSWKIFLLYKILHWMLHVYIFSYSVLICVSPVDWGSWIHLLHICWEVRPLPTSILDMTLNHLIVRLQ